MSNSQIKTNNKNKHKYTNDKNLINIIKTPVKLCDNKNIINNCDEKSVIGNIIKKIKEGIMNDNIKNEIITPIYDEIFLFIYPHYIIFFALMIAILFLEILIFFAIFATIKLR
jgi:hypothetical protein